MIILLGQKNAADKIKFVSCVFYFLGVLNDIYSYCFGSPVPVSCPLFFSSLLINNLGMVSFLL